MRIQVNIEDVRNTASALAEMSGTYADCINRLMSRIHEINAVWQGADSQAFFESAETLRPQMQELKDVIESYARVLDNCAAAYSDLQASRAASARLL